MIKRFSLFFFLLFVSFSYSQNFLDADATGDAYTRITSKGFAYEVPDCVHPIPHITEEWNSDIKKYVFIFGLHVTPDNDRCINFDRQRTEMKTYDASADSMKGFYNDTVTFRWKFKLDALFQPSPNFTHIHQIKPGDGPNQDNPVITITPRYKSSGNQLQVIFISPDSITTTEYQVNLAPFLGVWVEAYEKIVYSDNGSYNLVIKRVSDESVLLSYINSNLAMWRSGSTFMRPKWGIYRSLNSPSYLRDEFIRFDDFSMDKGSLVNLPSAPSGLSTSILSGGRIKLTWTDNSKNEDQFRIDRSLNGTKWAYYAAAPKNSNIYTDTVIAINTYYYRVRAENTFGNSAFSNTASYYYIPSVQLSLTALIEGLYNGTSMVSDTVTVELHNSSTPYALVESQKGILNTSGVGLFNFTNAVNGVSYYIVIKHRNAIETWSAAGQTFASSVLSYDFTSVASQAYGNNMKLKGGKYCLYSGDVNHDGLVDLSDLKAVDNDNSVYVVGYTNTDLNGDGIVDLSDLIIVDNNSAAFVGRITPPGAPSAIHVKRPVHSQNLIRVKNDL